MISEIKTDRSTDIEEYIFRLSCIYPYIQDNTMENTIMIYKAISDPEKIYLYQAMKKPDKDNFLQAMDKEIADQIGNGNFSITKRTDISKEKTILPAVCQMKRKRDIMTRLITKYKVRLNIDGSRIKATIMLRHMHLWLNRILSESF